MWTLVGLCIFLCVVVTIYVVVIITPTSTKPSLTIHGQTSNQNTNVPLKLMKNVGDAYIMGDSILFPVVLYNGGLPLISIHVGESGSMAAAILDTASEHLLLGDIEKCTSCSNRLFGGARGSDSENDASYGKVITIFPSQKDHIEYRSEDIYIDEFHVPNAKFGLVTHRQNLVEGNTETYNAMGIGGAQTIEDSFLNQIHKKLRPGKTRQFGFVFGRSGDIQKDKKGIWVLGPIPKTMQSTHVTSIPLWDRPLSKYSYTTHLEKVLGILKDNKVIQYPIENFPVMFDTGSNFMRLPFALQQHFHELDRFEMVFYGGHHIVLPNKTLMWNGKPKHSLVKFSKRNIITIGTIVMSHFKAIAFELDPRPFLHVYQR